MILPQRHSCKFITILFYLIQIYILSNFSILFAQQESTSKWLQTETPVFSDLNNLILFSSDSGVATGKQIIILKDKKWTKMTVQPPFDIELLSANSLESIFVSNQTDFQESELYYWDGKIWENIYHPLANSIAAMFFEDRDNGIIAGLGEIAVLKNNNWEFLPPPTNQAIIELERGNDNIWALAGLRTGLYKFDKKWKLIPNSENILHIQLFNNSLYVIGTDFWGEVVSDSIEVISHHKNLYQISSFSVINDSSIVCVGLNGIILKYYKNEWSQIECPANSKLNSIKMLSKDEGWCVGQEATILHLTRKQADKWQTNIWKGFENITFYKESKVIDDEYGVVTADFNNDGLVDIFTCGLYERNHLYINIGGIPYKSDINFIDEASERGVSGHLDNEKKSREFNLGTCAADFDNDGNIDLYVSSLNSSNKIYKNRGDGFFVDYTSTANAGGKTTDRTNSLSTADVDNDGDLDIFLTNENTTNRLYLNNGAGIFAEVTLEAQLLTEFGGTSCSFGDIDNDGDQDLYVANWSAENKLYKNLLKETNELKFLDISKNANVAGYSYTKSNGVVFADIDNDADLDLFVTNRKASNRLYINDGIGKFSDKTEQYFGLDSSKSYGVVINDFDGDSYKDIYISNVGENQFYKNIRGKQFVDQTNKYNADILGYSTGSAAADFDNDGDLDLYSANYVGASSTLLINKKNYQNYIIVKINGVTINRSGIGTKIYAYQTGHLGDISFLLHFSEINGGSGYGSMSELTTIIPTINYKGIDLKIVFPSSKVIVHKNIAPKTELNISDEIGFQRSWIFTKKYFYRLFFDGHNLFNLLKWCLVLLLILFSILWGRKKYKWLPKIIIGSSFFIALNYYLLSSAFEYKDFIFSTLLPLGSTITLISLFHLFYDKIMLRKKVELEKQKLQEKISRDLHDDLASTLGSISIYLELLKQAIESGSENIWQLFNKSNNLLNNAKQTITDLIWTIKPTTEPITNFAARIRENFTDIFRNRNISFTVSNERIESDILLTSIEKHNLYLIIKEALNNILKYSDATKVIISITSYAGLVNFTIRDNGIGFNYAQNKSNGNGLTNMINRGKELNADVNISSEKGEGALIEVSFKK